MAPRKENDKKERPLELGRKLLYLQGLWWDPPEPDLEFYHQLFSPRFAQLLFNNQGCRVLVQLFQKSYLMFAVASLAVQIFFFFPMGMFVFMDNKKDVLINFYSLLLSLVVCSGLLTYLFNKDNLYLLNSQIHLITKSKLLQDHHRKGLLQETHVFCNRLTKYIHFAIVPFVTISMTILCVSYLLPHRKLFVREWYPFDWQVSPNFELVLLWRYLHIVVYNAAASTMISFVTSLLIYIKSFFKILNSASCSISNHPQQYYSGSKTQQITIRDRFGRHDTRSGSVCRVRNKEGMLVKDGGRHRIQGTPLFDHLYSRGRLMIGCDLEQRRIDLPTTTGGRPPRSHIMDYPSKVRNDLLVPSRRVFGVGRVNLQNRQSRDFLHFNRRQYKCQKKKTLLFEDFVNCHVEVLRMVQTLSSVMSGFLMVMFVVNIVTLSVTVLFLTIIDSDLPTKAMFLTFSLEVMTLYMLINYLANVITSQSLETGEAIYNSDWTGAPESFKKSALIIMTRANRPVQFKPTGLEPLSLALFADVTMRSYKMLSTVTSFIK